jgi:hypothetical protein
VNPFQGIDAHDAEQPGSKQQQTDAEEHVLLRARQRVTSEPPLVKYPVLPSSLTIG